MSKTLTIALSLPVGENSRVSNIIAAAIARAAKDNPGLRDLSKDEADKRFPNALPEDSCISAAVETHGNTPFPPEVRAAAAISFLYTLSQFRREPTLPGLRALQSQFHSMLIMIDKEIMTPTSAGDSPFNTLSKAFFADLDDLENGKSPE